MVELGNFGADAPIPGVDGINVFWLFFGLLFIVVFLLFQRMRFFGTIW